MNCLVGLDVGSTTVKIVVLDENKNIIYKKYCRHLSKVREVATKLIEEAKDVLEGKNISISIAGSAGLGMAEAAKINFVQEVFAARLAAETYVPEVDVAVELGGEDAKIIFFTGGEEERMNGSCAGGTGAFIDQMATLLGLTTEELDELALQANSIYNIASRCGVFAKSDIQSLLNQGANKADIAASIYMAVVEQTVAGLAQGREIKGNVLFLGGPLTFQKGLREQFKTILTRPNDRAIFPENSEYFVALGAALSSEGIEPISYSEILNRLEHSASKINTINTLPPLFASVEEYEEFESRHKKAEVKYIDINSYEGNAYLGIDAGSTTTKMVLISEDGHILYDYYGANKGEPLEKIKEELVGILKAKGDKIKIRSSAVTGYGEDLMQHAFGIDYGLVETIAHYRGVQYFKPDVDFILDIGGQDIKCIKIKNGAIDWIILNEACSSGCGSFISSFAEALGYNVADFARLGLKAEHPVDLGSRCTVFMNSSVKQAQKDGATIEDISAGLAISVVKNALYKVIRINSAKALGENIVVQGGTFYNPAVLRGLEKELGVDVIRPSISGLMGAFGAALYAQDRANAENKEVSSLFDLETIANLENDAKNTICKLCPNHCHLTVNKFNSGKKFITGNKCQKPLGVKVEIPLENVYQYKKELLSKCFEYDKNFDPNKTIGLPLALNMFENLPFWYPFFKALGFNVVVSGFGSRALYRKGQHTIPSDTVCYPAKLVHGHIEELMDMGVKKIFYPCMPYNFNEGHSDNHYNCPVVAYYPELIKANVPFENDIDFMMPYMNMATEKEFLTASLKYFPKALGVRRKAVKEATKVAYEEYYKYKENIRKYCAAAIKRAEEENLEVIVLAGRPYHIDPEINHGIDKVISSLGFVIVSEDGLPWLEDEPKVKVLNQWTYHARLYNAAHYVSRHDNLNLVQLVSFGCGLDAITTDEIREILDANHKLYTQLKIDEISDLGAARIRIRSLEAAIKEKKEKREREEQ